jgi:branched-chain amino acid transport system ATP-binding protein
LLLIKQVNTYYGYVHALKNVSIEVNEGEFVTLIGANGAGKTTLLKSIIGLQPIKSGELRFAGTPLDQQRSHDIIRRGISIVPEGRRIFPEFTVAENLQIGAHARRSTQAEMNEDIEEVLELFPRLKERWKQKAGTMSGGEQQMVAIGRALMGRPKLLLLDEPSLGLAPQMVDELMQKLQEIHRKGTTILLVEQNVHLALEISQRGYIVETGEIIAADDSKALLSSDLIRKSYLGVED